jgi:hypothetical protein
MTATDPDKMPHSPPRKAFVDALDRLPRSFHLLVGLSLIALMYAAKRAGKNTVRHERMESSADDATRDSG